MRLGMRGWKFPPHKAFGYCLMVVGAIIMLIAMPFFIYVALVGILIVYVGYTLNR